MEDEMLTRALDYRARGLSVVPIAPGEKHPLIPWTEFQRRLPAAEEIREWYRKHPEAGVGLVCGSVSAGLVVLDVDPRNGGLQSISERRLHLPPTPCVKTGGGGFHYYFRESSPPKKSVLLSGVELQGEGSIVVAPPSRHKSGRRYEWAENLGLDETQMADLPNWVWEKLKTSPAENPALRHADNGSDSVTNGTTERKIIELLKPYWKKGNRNHLSLALSGFLANKGWPHLKTQRILEELTEGDEECSARLTNLARTYQRLEEDKPIVGWTGLYEVLPEDILEQLQELVQEDAARKIRVNKATELMRLVEPLDLFHDENGTPYAAIPEKDHRAIWPCKSNSFRTWLAREYYRQKRAAPDQNSINSALAVLEGKACHEGQKLQLHNRVAWHDDAIWYDLTDDRWRTVRISADGWEIVEKPPILFRRYNHQHSQVTPAASSDLKELLQFFNMPDKQHELLLLVYIISCLVPDIPHPISVFIGEQGSAKSTQHRLIKKLLDPSSVGLLSLPHSQNEMAQQLAHHWLVFYDNLSSLPTWASDVLCRSVTGEGFSKRQLYSDEDDHIFKYRRCVGLNGINNVAEKPDLLDRTLLFRLQGIPPEKRMDEASFWKKFEELQPQFLGAVFTALSGALKAQRAVKPPLLYRLADFTLWGCAIAEAIGYGQEKFLEAYGKNIGIQHEEAIEGSLVASLLVDFMAVRPSWEGSSTELLKELEKMAENQGINTHLGKWPRAPQALTRQLNALKTNLRAQGIQLHTGLGRRRIRIEKSPGIPNIS